jgi:hypothetical protein
VAEPEGVKGLSRQPRSQRRRRPESSPYRLADAEATRVAAAECESDAFLFETVAARSRIVQMVTQKAQEIPTSVDLENFWSPLSQNASFRKTLFLCSGERSLRIRLGLHIYHLGNVKH